MIFAAALGHLVPYPSANVLAAAWAWDSVLAGVDDFYSEVLQDLKAWAAAPPKMRPSSAGEPTTPSSLSSTDFSSQDGPSEVVELPTSDGQEQPASISDSPMLSQDDPATPDTQEQVGVRTCPPVGPAPRSAWPACRRRSDAGRDVSSLGTSGVGRVQPPLPSESASPREAISLNSS